jgi:hypothetical protein
MRFRAASQTDEVVVGLRRAVDKCFAREHRSRWVRSEKRHKSSNFHNRTFRLWSQFKFL